MSRISPLQYAFAVAKIRALENHLLGRDLFRQAAESGLAEALKLFVEGGKYPEPLLHVSGSHDLEAILAEELAHLRSLVLELLIDRDLHPLLEPHSTDTLTAALARRIGPFLTNYLRHVIDLHNIKTFLRLRAVGVPAERPGARWVNGGFLNKENVLAGATLEVAAWMRSLEYPGSDGQPDSYAHFFRKAIMAVQEKKSFVELEVRIAHFLMSALKTAKYFIFGPEPVLAYFWARIAEMNLIRFVVLAKLNRLPGESVIERLDELYSG